MQAQCLKKSKKNKMTTRKDVASEFPMQIMLVDDIDMNLKLGKVMLKAQGFDVRHVCVYRSPRCCMPCPRVVFVSLSITSAFVNIRSDLFVLQRRVRKWSTLCARKANVWT